MEIETVSLIGLGNLGILFGDHWSRVMPDKGLRIVAGADRVQRYQKEGIYYNGRRCKFNYMSGEEACKPADLVIFSVKYNGLADAIATMGNHVGKNTVILSLLNGIVSEEILADAYGPDKVLYCVAQGMDSLKMDNQLTYKHMGILCFGEREPGVISDKARRVARFFERTGVVYELLTDMYFKLWSKFMLNVGVNQTVAVIEGSYGDIQEEGKARQMMIEAMREVIPLAEREGINLGEADIAYWLEVLSKLRPEGKPSMRQDLEAGCPSEVALFGGTVLELGRKHGVNTPVNRWLYEQILARESQF